MDRPTQGMSGPSSRQSSTSERVTVQKSGGVEFLPTLEEVRVTRVEVNRVKEIEELNRKIAEATEKALEADRVRRDEAILAAEAHKMCETSRANAIQSTKVVDLQDKLKATSLEEERELEAKRAMVHERAITAENARANARAEEVLYIEQEKEAQKLALKHEANAEQAAKVHKAYEIVRQEAEKRKLLMQNDTEFKVVGELVHDIPTAAQIRVEVQPQLVPEVPRVAPTELPKSSAKLAEVTEHIPPHERIHVPVERTEQQFIREDTQTIRVGKEEALAGVNVQPTARTLTPEMQAPPTNRTGRAL